MQTPRQLVRESVQVPGMHPAGASGRTASRMNCSTCRIPLVFFPRLYDQWTAMHLPRPLAIHAALMLAHPLSNSKTPHPLDLTPPGALSASKYHRVLLTCIYGGGIPSLGFKPFPPPARNGIKERMPYFQIQRDRRRRRMPSHFGIVRKILNFVAGDIV